MGFGTTAVHAGVEPDPSTGAIMTPVFMTSTYVQSAPGVHKGYAYGRGDNPTRRALEGSLAGLEGGRFALTYASGLAAADAVARILSPGGEILSSSDIYGGSYRLFERFHKPLGVACRFVEAPHPTALAAHVSAKTKIVWIETPTNPLMNIVDIEGVCRAVKAANAEAICVVDNTFASPYLQNPLAMGADVVMHSATKYLGGHSDVVMGALVLNDEALYKRLKFVQFAAGAVPGPMDCFLVLRGIKTLHVRMERACANAERVARFLKDHPKVDAVHWPGFPSHPGYDVARRQMRGFGGMLSFSLKGDAMADAKHVMSATRIFALGESLGGVESLVAHPATMTHGAVPKAVREAAGLKDTLIRLSVGIEDAADLIADLRQALAGVGEPARAKL